MKRHLLSLTIGSVLTTTCASVADSAITAEEAALMRQQIARLESEVAHLRSGRDGDWLSEQRADEIRGIVYDVLADADTRASLLGSSLTAGWDNGFKIGSADGNYSLRIAGRHQFRYVYNFQDRPPLVTDPDTDEVIGTLDRHRSGFENRRTRLTFSGHVFDPSWRYQIQGNFGSGSGGTFGLLDAYIDKVFDNGITIRFGQFRPRFMYEDSNSSARQLAVERSMVNGAFAQSRTQGVEVRGDIGDNLKWSVGFTEGIRSRLGTAGAGANTTWSQRTTEFSFVGRMDYLAAGTWRQFRDFSSWSGEEFGLLLGAGAVWQKDEYGTLDTGEAHVFRWTADVNAKFGGIALFAAVVGNHEKRTGGNSVDQFGFVAQGGFFIVPDEWELYGRYEWGTTDGMGADLSFITIGANYYMQKHNLKWQNDIGIGLKEVSGFWSGNGFGTRTDRPGEDMQFVIRSQIQLAF
jgi:hypothetical protein